jgi:hypothetical protein
MRQLLPIDDQETCGIVWDHEVASVRGVFFNYKEAPRSLFFLNINGGMRAKWRKKRMRRLQETTQETENISHQVHLLHLLIEFKRLAEGLAGGCQGQADSPPAWSIQIFSDSLVILAMRRSIHCPQHLPLLILYSSVLSMAPTFLDLGDIFLAVMATPSTQYHFPEDAGRVSTSHSASPL